MKKNCKKLAGDYWLTGIYKLDVIGMKIHTIHAKRRRSLEYEKKKDKVYQLAML